jgi:hypothetical protein
MEDQLDTQSFALGLRTVRRHDGDPTYKYLQRQTGYSPASLSRALSGKTFPRWEFTEKFLRACHVSEQEISGTWLSRWIAVAGKVSPLGGDLSADDEALARRAHVGTECAQCGALVLNQILHKAWHAAYTPREPGRTTRKPLKPGSTTTSRHALRSLPG